MNVLLLMPKELYILTRFGDACRRHGFSLSIMMAPRPPTRSYLISFENDSYQTVEEVPAELTADAMAPFLGRFDAVVAAGEFSVVLGEELSAVLGLFHNNLERAGSYRNKHLMRERFAEAGVSQPRLLATFESLAEVDGFDWSSVHFPVIAKPVDMTASFYVRLCDDVQSARRVYQRIFKHSQSFAGGGFLGQGLLEEVAVGPEYSAECVVQDRRVVALFSTTKFVSPYPACDEIGHLCGEPFADGEVTATVRREVERIVRAWDVTSAVMHVEYKLHDRKVKVIEGACRIGGDMISELVELTHGVSLEECLLLLRCKKDVAPALERRNEVGGGYCHGIKYLFSDDAARSLPADVEVLRMVRYPGLDGGEGRGFGAEARLGHVLVRSRSLPSLKEYLAVRTPAEPQATRR
jgi:biotin carboxylase